MTPKAALRIWQSLFYMSLLTVLVLSLLPIDHPDISPNDKVNHVLAYAALSVLAYLAHRRRITAVLGVFAFGALVEILQGLTGYRFMSFADVVANGIGAVIGAGISFIFKSKASSPAQ